MKNTYVNNESHLSLPNIYGEISTDEMSYIDGGVIFRPIFNGAGWYFELNSTECADAAAYLAAGAATAAGLTAILGLSQVGAPAAGIAAICTTMIGVGSAYMWYCSNGNGFRAQYRNGNLVSSGRF